MKILLLIPALLILNNCSSKVAEVSTIRTYSSAKLCYEYNQGYGIGSQLYYSHPMSNKNDLKIYLNEIKRELLRRGAVTQEQIRMIDAGTDVCHVNKGI